MSAEIIKTTNEDNTLDEQKRAFIRRFGKYAAVGVGMATLMTPTMSSAGNYGKQKHGCNNGFGNGDQDAPGKSEWHNHAENNTH